MVLVPAARTSAQFLAAPRDSSRLLRGGEKISRRREIFRGFGGRSRIWGSYPRYLARNLASSCEYICKIENVEKTTGIQVWCGIQV